MLSLEHSKQLGRQIQIMQRKIQMSVKPSETKTIKNLQDEAKKVVLAASSRWIDVIFQEELCNTDRNEYISAADYFRESVSELFALNKLAKIVNKQS